MSPDNEKLEPTPFELATPPEPLEKVARPTPNWILPALGGLLVLALVVVFWLPQQVSSPEQVADDSAESSTSPSGTATGTKVAVKDSTAPDASPWSDAQAAKLRKEAQDVLAELLELQYSLEERGAKQWASEPFSAAAAAATAGDELYRARDYTEAIIRYQESLETLQSIAESVPAVVDVQLDLARQGIEDGLPEQVTQALDLATLIEPENAELPALRQRAANLEPLMALMELAADSENNGDLAQAEAQLAQATALDQQHLRAAAEFQRVAAAYVDQQFNDAMSDGYSALDQDRYAQAREQFRKAAGLLSGSAEAASALQEVASAEQASKLTRLKRDGGRLEESEQWQKAVEAYEQAAAIDSNVLFADQGLERSRSRARLDKQFRAAIDKPERLWDIAVAEATGKLLAQAKNISPQGPVLQQQISQLDTLLQQANTLVSVTLRSDAETEVIIYKIKRLGRFEQQQLTLRPGTYKIRGSRNGYRDVLESITISHKGAPAPITIACTEPIN